MSDLDKSILYWIKEFNYKWIDCGKLIDYIKIHWVVTKESLVREFVRIENIKNLPSLDILDWDKICQKSLEYEKIGDNYYLNAYALESNYELLKQLKLIK